MEDQGFPGLTTLQRGLTSQELVCYATRDEGVGRH